MSDPYTSYATRQTSQAEPIPGSSQIQNEAGGYVWQLDDWGRLDRFLVLGSDGGTYYASQQTLTRENAEVVLRCLEADGPRTVQVIRDVSLAGRAPKNDPAIFALAMAAGTGDLATRQAAFKALPEVCRIGTHLFHFATYVEQFRGWGRGLRRAVAAWYDAKDLNSVAYQAVKYRQRDGWSHRDLLRLAHPEEHPGLYEWICGRGTVAVPPIVRAFEHAQRAISTAHTAELIRAHNLPREAIQSDHLNSPEVWEALLERMPMTAMIRNLATMTRVGVLAPGSDGTTKVLAQLNDREALHKARVHPIAVLAAQVTYASGHGVRGQNTWNPVVQIVDALDAAFYETFDNVEPTGKRYLLGLDVSGSMGWGNIAGVPGLTPRVGSAAMALITAATEPAYEAVGFTSYGGYHNKALTALPISPRQRLNDAVEMVSGLPYGGTDCALPMLYATQEKREVDVFVIFTDNETWAGTVHPAQALRKYREQSGIAAKLIVVGMTSNGFSIADPSDGGMLDVVGFDTATPTVMSDFAR